MSGPRTLLLPCAGLSSRYPDVRPKWLLTLPDGALALERAAASVPRDAYQRLVVAIRAEHEEAYGCREVLRRTLGPVAEIVVLDRDTRGPAHTVAEMLRRTAVTGRIAIKDCDSFFEPMPLPETSFAAVVDIRATPKLSNVGAKSFAVVKGDRIVEIAEKNPVSRFACVGLYGVSEASLFLDHFGLIARNKPDGEIFISHVLTDMIGAGHRVMPQSVSGLVDVGTLEDWRAYVRARGTVVCDLDGVVFKNQSHFFKPFWDDPEEPIAANVDTLRGWQAGGAQLIFMTARPERYRARTESALAQLGLRAHALIMDCHHGRRLLVNDHARSNPFPAAVGVSIARNTATLGEHLDEWR